MISGRKVLAVIPARGGSKGVPRKNIRNLGGKPLIAWAIDAALKSKLIDRVIVSTDDGEIAEVARLYGADVPFMRPEALAKDDTPGVAPVIHALQEVPGYDCVVLLQPTSPLRTNQDIDGCIEKMYISGSPACVSVVQAQHSPYWMYTLDTQSHMEPIIYGNNPILRRQDSPLIYSLNGAVYVANTKWFMENQGFISPETVAYPMLMDHSIDIDTEIDFLLAEQVFRRNQPSVL